MATGKARTKIVATIGPASEHPGTLERLVKAGVSVARINLAHGSAKDHSRMVEAVRTAARHVGQPIAIMVDLAGPKIRVGQLRDGRVTLEKGRRLRLTPREVAGTAQLLTITEPRLPRDVRPGEPVFLADGTLELKVLRVDGEEIECEIVIGGLLLPSKGVNLPKTRLRLPSMTDKDRVDLAHALHMDVDLVALSFVREAADVHRARKLLGRRRVPLIAKIEKREAIANLDAILETANGVMVARGDLAVETSFEEVPLLQKRIITAANRAAKPVITATQMLLSMVDQARPTRAEAADVANAILDGTDAVMLSEETARGAHPVRAVETMARIALHAEERLVSHGLEHAGDRIDSIAEAVSEAAVHVARDVGAHAIVTPTRFGGTARMVARLRPAVPIVALSEDRITAQSLLLTWGVQPLHRPRLGRFEDALRVAEESIRRLALLRPGERYVVTASYPQDQSSNLMTVQVHARPRRRPTP